MTRIGHDTQRTDWLPQHLVAEVLRRRVPRIPVRDDATATASAARSQIRCPPSRVSPFVNSRHAATFSDNSCLPVNRNFSAMTWPLQCAGTKSRRVWTCPNYTHTAGAARRFARVWKWRRSISPRHYERNYMRTRVVVAKCGPQRARCASCRGDEGVLAGASHADDDTAVLAVVEAEEDQLCLVAMQQFEAAAAVAAV